MSRTALVTVPLLLISLVWGATFTMTKDALSTVSVFPFLFARFLVAAVLLFAIAFLTPSIRRSFHRRTVFAGALLGLLLFAAYAFQTLGLRGTSPGVAGFLTGLNVILVPILSLPILHRAPHWRTWAGTLLSVTGLALISGPALLGLRPGDLEVLLCAVFLALQILFVDVYGRDLDALALAAVEILVVALMSLALGLWLDRPEVLDARLWLNPQVLWPLLFNAVLGTSLAYWGQNALQRLSSAAQVAVVFATEPVFAALVAFLMRGDTLPPAGIAGGALIFVSMLVTDPNVPLLPVCGHRSSA